MDIWAWVHDAGTRLRSSGQERLANLIWALPEAVVEEQHERTEAIVPEALALARALKAPWIELFVRHWSLQSRVLHKGEGTAAVAEAVSLLEFAHRADTRECPQSVCAVQDLCACYGFADGPGYATEREAVARETLARIDATWPCWSCVSSELCDALRDARRPADALDQADAAIAAQLATGDRDAVWDFENTRAEALMALGRVDEALELLDRGQVHGRQSTGRRRYRATMRADALSRLGRLDEAVAALPSAADVAETTSLHDAWAATLERLVDAGAVENTMGISVTLAGFVERIERRGAPRNVIEVAEVGLRLAVRRGAARRARTFLGAMERALPQLHRPLDAPGRVAAARAAVDGLTVDLPDSPEHVFALLEGERSDPDADLALLDAARTRWPEHAELRLLQAAALLAADEAGEALGLLRPLLGPETPDSTALMAVDAALQVGDLSIEPLLRLSRTSPSNADWMLGRHAFANQDWRTAIEHFRRVVEENPEAVNTRRLWAAAAQALGDHEEALARLDEVVARRPPEGDDWPRMVSATLLGRWEVVRESAARVGLPLEGEGEIDEVWGPCKVRVGEEDLWALRTGPVTARIVQIGRSMEEQHFRDRVVFQPEPVNQPEGERPIFVYPLLKRLEPGRCWSFEVDGVRPENWEAIEAMLDSFGGECRVLSGESYTLGGRAAVYAVVAVPDAVDPLSVHLSLLRAAGGQLTWLPLVERVGDANELARQRALAEALSL